MRYHSVGCCYHKYDNAMSKLLDLEKIEAELAKGPPKKTLSGGPYTLALRQFVKDHRKAVGCKPDPEAMVYYLAGIFDEAWFYLQREKYERLQATARSIRQIRQSINQDSN